MSKVLFIIDPQNDFIDAPQKSGSLAVPGAYQDMLRLVEYIKNTEIQNIVVSLDTHSVMDIAHSSWWQDSQGQKPSPFTMITLEDFEAGVWSPVMRDEYENTHNYLKELKQKGKKTLVIWPDHCIAGTWGHEVNPELLSAIQEWEPKSGKLAVYVKKGENPNTEHYSAIKAEVVLEDNGYSDVNYALLGYLSASETIVIAGEAKSHCVADTVYDMVYCMNDFTPGNVKQIEILDNCMSPVPGFEDNANQFIKWCKEMSNINVVSA